MNVTKKSPKNTKETANVSYTVKSFGEKLIELRNERGITQAESAELIGITRNTLSMYERGERCPNIDIAVNTANAYNVSLDYLFGIGFKDSKKNHESLYDYFSEESISLLDNSHVRDFVDAMLSHPHAAKISDMLYAVHYKPLINSYETNYISRLISDLLYTMVVNVNKDAYQLRPMLENEVYQLLDAVNDCIRDIEYSGHLLHTDYDEYLDCQDNILTELENIKCLLENTPDTDYNAAVNEGFTKAIKMIAKKEIEVELVSPDDPRIKTTEAQRLIENEKNINLK